MHVWSGEEDNGLPDEIQLTVPQFEGSRYLPVITKADFDSL